MEYNSGVKKRESKSVVGGEVDYIDKWRVGVWG
jgi:hypothetical protein